MLNQNGRSSEAHLCADCAGQYARNNETFFSGMIPLFGMAPSFGDGLFSAMPVGMPVRSMPESGPSVEPAASPVDPEFQQRRELELLRGRLQEAVAAEDYETAAKLRDEIRKTEADKSVTVKLAESNERKDESI